MTLIKWNRIEPVIALCIMQHIFGYGGPKGTFKIDLKFTEYSPKKFFHLGAPVIFQDLSENGIDQVFTVSIQVIFLNDILEQRLEVEDFVLH